MPAGTPTEIVDRLNTVCDIERIIARLTVGRANPRDLSGLARCLIALPKLFDKLESLPNTLAVSPELKESRGFVKNQGQFLNSAILPDPAAPLREGGRGQSRERAAGSQSTDECAARRQMAHAGLSICRAVIIVSVVIPDGPKGRSGIHISADSW